METSITSETISQQTIHGDSEGLNANVENNKEPTELEQMQNKVNKAIEIYFKYFLPQRMARMKATVRRQGREKPKSWCQMTRLDEEGDA